MVQRTCSIAGCDRPAKARTWCRLHYRRWETYGDAEALPVRKYAKRYACLERDPLGHKKCRVCSDWKPLTEFRSGTGTADRLSSECKDCLRRSEVRRMYGLSPESYDAMLTSQGGACRICRSTFSPEGARPHVDHDHSCCPGIRSCGACVRGILCSNCNTGLGLFGDDPAQLRIAIEYVEGATTAR